MSTMALNLLPAPIDEAIAVNPGMPCTSEVVEVNLLLPSDWANDLIALSQARRQSVAQVIRSMIGHALHEKVATV